MKRILRSSFFFLLVLRLVPSEVVRTHDPVSSNVRYTGEIVRILERRCLQCHGNDGLAMPLTTYREVRAWGRAIREEIIEQRMPPWSAARGYGRFQNALALTARETTAILTWLDGGMPRGDDRDLPVRPTPSGTSVAAGTTRSSDLRLTVPPQAVPALETHVVRRIPVDTNLEVERAVERLVVNPGNRRVLRAAFVFAGDPDRDGKWLAAWLPWQRDPAWPAAGSIRLAARARLTVELHYRGVEDPATDATSIAIFFADERGRLEPESTHELADLTMSAGAQLRLAHTTTVRAILPAAGASGTSLEFVARRPNGATDVLLWIPAFRREWPQALLPEDPITLPAGTTLALIAHPSDAGARVRLSIVK